jgi:hypothetical protein
MCKKLEHAMNDKITDGIHWSFWVISTLMLIWNVMGCVNYFIQMNPEMVSSYRETEQAIISSRPSWATVGFAVAVFGGVLGCILLMLKKSISFYLFIASLLGVVVTMIHTLGAGIDFGFGEISGIIIMPLVVSAFLIWYSKYAEKKGWINT